LWARQNLEKSLGAHRAALLAPGGNEPRAAPVAPAKSPGRHPSPNFRRDAAAIPTRRATTISSRQQTEEPTVRKTLIALTAATGLIGLGTIGASAAPVAPAHVPAHAAAIQQADWYCGPRCEYWRHRRWEERHEWREHHYRYYGYNRGYYGDGGYYGYR
jgi:hypothetical protein